MQELQPQMKEIQDKYKDTPEKMNVELNKFYKAAGYNPMSGCLPLLIQFPLIIAMFNLFNNYFEFRGASFIPGWIPDLSVGDSVMGFPFTVPFLGWDQLRILPVIYVISQLLFGKVTPQAGGGSNGQMKMMMYGMPVFFFFIFYNAPSGLLLYWTTSNMLQLVQQVIINKMMGKKKNLAVPKPAIFVPRKKKR
jgi:YidC/Oxa1 family membrane protein insertase